MRLYKNKDVCLKRKSFGFTFRISLSIAVFLACLTTSAQCKDAVKVRHVSKRDVQKDGHLWIRQFDDYFMIGGKSETVPFPKVVSVKSLLDRLAEAERLSVCQGHNPTVTVDEADKIEKQTEVEITKLCPGAIPELIAFLSQPEERYQHSARQVCVKTLAKSGASTIEPILCELNKEKESDAPLSSDLIYSLLFMEHDASEQVVKLALSTSENQRDLGYGILMDMVRRSIKRHSPYASKEKRGTWDIYSQLDSKDEVYLPAAVGSLLEAKLLSSKVNYERECLARALGFIFPSDEKHIQSLIQLCENETEENVRLEAIESLGRIMLRDYRSGKPRGEETHEIATILAGNEQHLSKETIRTVADCLRGLSAGQNKPVKVAADKALCMVAIGRLDYLDDLIRAVNSSDSETASIACEAAREGGPQTANIVINTLEKNIYEGSAKNRINMLTELKFFLPSFPSMAVPVLVQMLKNPPLLDGSGRDVRGLAAIMLTTVGESIKPFLPEIQKVVDSGADRNPYHAAMVIRVYNKSHSGMK